MEDESTAPAHKTRKTVAMIACKHFKTGTLTTMHVLENYAGVLAFWTVVHWVWSLTSLGPFAEQQQRAVTSTSMTAHISFLGTLRRIWHLKDSCIFESALGTHTLSQLVFKYIFAHAQACRNHPPPRTLWHPIRTDDRRDNIALKDDVSHL
jgi:hypothetical protein